MYDVYTAWIHIWPISVRLMRSPGEDGGRSKGLSARRRAVEISVRAGVVDVAWRIEDRTRGSVTAPRAAQGGALV